MNFWVCFAIGAAFGFAADAGAIGLWTAIYLSGLVTTVAVLARKDVADDMRALGYDDAAIFIAVATYCLLWPAAVSVSVSIAAIRILRVIRSGI